MWNVLFVYSLYDTSSFDIGYKNLYWFTLLNINLFCFRVNLLLSLFKKNSNFHLKYTMAGLFFALFCILNLVNTLTSTLFCEINQKKIDRTSYFGRRFIDVLFAVVAFCEVKAKLKRDIKCWFFVVRIFFRIHPAHFYEKSIKKNRWKKTFVFLKKCI